MLTVKLFTGCKDSCARRVPVSPRRRVPYILVAALPRWASAVNFLNNLD